MYDFTLRDHVEEIERVPWAERLTQPSAYHLLVEAAARYPADIALIETGGALGSDARSWTFGAMTARITGMANAFIEAGVGPRDAVAILVPPGADAHMALWAAGAAGIAAPINFLLEAGQVESIIRESEAKAVVAIGPDDFFGIWKKAVPAAEHLGAVLFRIGGGAAADGAIDLDQAIAALPTDRLLRSSPPAPDDIGAYFHTGGTTGAPKIVPHTHAAQAVTGMFVGPEMEMGPGDVMLNALPAFHVQGVYVAGLGPLCAGAAVLLPGPFGFRNPALVQDFWKVVEKYRISHCVGVPTILAALLNTPLADADVSSLRYFGCGAAPMPPAVFEAFERDTGIKIFEGYGMTEATVMVTAHHRRAPRRQGSVGARVPYMQIKIAALDPEGGHVRDCDPGESGAVLIKGATVFHGYKNPIHNNGIWPQPGWFNTGDLGRLDEDGYLYLQGRAKDLIIRGGHNIDPQMIEEAMHRHPAVALAAAVGLPDAHAGQVPIAYVTLKPGAEATPEDLVAFARTAIPERAACPHEVVVLTSMPMTMINKVFKPALRDDATMRALTAALAPVAERAKLSITMAKSKAIVALPQETAESVEEETREILGRYTVPFEIVRGE